MTGAKGLSSGLGGFLGMMREGRTQAFGIVFGRGRPAASFGGDCLARQCESLMTRFLGAVAVSRSSSSSLWGTGVFFALPGRSGLAPTDFPRSCTGFQLGLSSWGFVFGVVSGLGEAHRLADALAHGRASAVLNVGDVGEGLLGLFKGLVAALGRLAGRHS